jgi:hypothetical protein
MITFVDNYPKLLSYVGQKNSESTGRVMQWMEHRTESQKTILVKVE